MNPVGAENGVRIYKKNKFARPLTGRLCGLLSTGCTLGGNAYLESMAIAKLNEIMDTMNRSVCCKGMIHPCCLILEFKSEKHDEGEQYILQC